MFWKRWLQLKQEQSKLFCEKVTNSVILFRADKIMLKKGNTIFKDNITLQDYEIKSGDNLELYYA
jgi:uncharacterized ubiquitin-like protein YukD